MQLSYLPQLTIRQLHNEDCISQFVQHKENKYIKSILIDKTWIQQDDMV